MQPCVVGEKIQEFDGVRYYLCGKYFQRKGVRLHRVVWEHYNGPVPDGFHIHHVNNDRADNRLENLECLSSREHLGGKHGEESGHRARKSLPRAHAAASRWHGSDEGRRWHSSHFEQHIRPILARRVKASCAECGGEYFVSFIRAKQSKCCGGACKARALRKSRKVIRDSGRVLHHGS